MRKKYARTGLGALSTWAAGGGSQGKSYDQEQDEAKAGTVEMHRESVLWYLRQKLQECGSFQASMMERRIMREMEKNKVCYTKHVENHCLSWEDSRMLRCHLQITVVRQCT